MLSPIRSLPSKIRGAFSGAGSLLSGVGRKIIQGLINGIKSMFSSVKNILGNLTSKLTSWKGPESVDKRLLRPQGRWIIEGFDKGLQDRVANVKATLTGLTSDLPGMIAEPDYGDANRVTRTGTGGTSGSSTAPVTINNTLKSDDPVKMMSMLSRRLLAVPDTAHALGGAYA